MLGETKAEVGWKSALRAIWPIVVVIAGLVMAGTIKSWHDLYDIKAWAAIITALVTKGLVAGVTARSVSVKA